MCYKATVWKHLPIIRAIFLFIKFQSFLFALKTLFVPIWSLLLFCRTKWRLHMGSRIKLPLMCLIFKFVKFRLDWELRRLICQPTKWPGNARHSGPTGTKYWCAIRVSTWDGVRCLVNCTTRRDMHKRENTVCWVLQKRGFDKRSHGQWLVSHRYAYLDFFFQIQQNNITLLQNSIRSLCQLLK